MEKNQQQQSAPQEQESQKQESIQQEPIQPEQVKKSGYFRWQGLVGFAVLMTIIVLVFMVYAGRIIQLGIEKGGSYYWGAQIDVANVDVTWSPFELSVQGLEATNPQKPTHNSFAFDEANVSVDLFQAILGRTIVHDLTIKQVDLDKQRQSVGEVTAIFETVNEDEQQSVLEDTVQALPSVDELMARSDLKTIQAGLNLKKTYETEKAAIDAIRKDLPTKAELKEYEAAVKRISDAKAETPEQIAQLAADLELLKKKFEKDKEVLSRAQKQLTESGKKVTAAVVELKDAPAHDMKVIEERYQFNQDGAQNFTQLIFGPQAAEYMRLAEEYYIKAKPLIDKINQAKQEAPPPPPEAGRFVHFVEENPQPDWLVEKAQISMKLAQGAFDIQVNELTAQHWKRNNATQLTVTSSNLLNTGKLALDGQFFIANKGDVTADAKWQVQGLKLVDMAVSDSEKFSLSLSEANLQLDGNVAFANSKFTNSNAIKLNNTTFGGKADNKMGELLVEVLSEVKNLSLDVGTSGNAENQDMSVASDLDGIIYDAMKKRFKVEVEKFKQKAQVRLKEKVAEELNLNQADANALKALEGDFSDMEKQLEALLKSKLQDKVQDTLKKKLLNKLSDFF